MKPAQWSLRVARAKSARATVLAARDARVIPTDAAFMPGP